MTWPFSSQVNYPVLRSSSTSNHSLIAADPNHFRHFQQFQEASVADVAAAFPKLSILGLSPQAKSAIKSILH